MAYIRDKKEELTGFQESEDYNPRIDIGPDFVMVYGVNDTLLDRVKHFRDRGYVIHLMTGISWGHYVDYLYGEWDGKEHLDEAQEDRDGNQILHGLRGEKINPYMVPTINFATYLTEKIKKAVDAGVEAIHVEEPEFWDRGGYSPAFKREYLMYYKTPWVAPHTSVDAHYKCARLKAYLYKRTIDRVSAAIKAYAMEKYGRLIRFYVPTHSLLNYTQWKIVSPEALLTDIPTVDGYIAQIWTGTSREKNTYEGKIAERTFECAYLEYGVMQELVKGTGRQMWFLQDPIEDQPCYDWDGYRDNYLKTVSAALLHPVINTYEICPWPRRVFNEGEKYPRSAPDAKEIGDEYRAQLNGCFQLLGDMPKCASSAEVKVGMLISDTSLYQRNFPDGCINCEKARQVGTVLHETAEEMAEYTDILFAGKGDRDLRLRYEKTNMLPVFYGLTLPLMKHGMPIRPVLLDNARRFVGYLNDYQVLVCSYEFCKPDYPDENAALATWVQEGGTLIYVGDGTDPFHNINSFWTGKYPTAAEHLFDLLGVKWPEKGDKAIYKVGKGAIAVWKHAPSALTFSRNEADLWRAFFGEVIESRGFNWKHSNYIMEKRDPYVIAAVFDETVDNSSLKLDGLYCDMYSATFNVVKNPVLNPGDNHTYFDFSKIEGETVRVIGTSARINAADLAGDTLTLQARAADTVHAAIRIRTPWPVKADGFTVVNDKDSKTALITFLGDAQDLSIVLKQNGKW